jgi:hypothetical protein
MEEAPENGKESSHSAHANGMNECSTNVKVEASLSFGFRNKGKETTWKT